MTTSFKYKYIISAIKDNDLNEVKRMHENNCPKDNPNYHIPNFCIAIAAKNGYLEIVKYLNSVNYEWNPDNDDPSTAYELAAYYGHLDVLTYLVENDCPRKKSEKNIMSYAASGGHVNCIQYLVQNGFLIDKIKVGLCDHAAKHGHFEALKYLHSIGCTWTSNGADEGNILRERKYHDCIYFMYRKDFLDKKEQEEINEYHSRNEVKTVLNDTLPKDIIEHIILEYY